MEDLKQPKSVKPYLEELMSAGELAKIKMNSDPKLLTNHNFV